MNDDFTPSTRLQFVLDWFEECQANDTAQEGAQIAVILSGNETRH